jgi:hypothetical protein
MKGKATWKPVGLCAKKWREAGHARGPVTSLPKPLTERHSWRPARATHPFTSGKAEGRRFP